MAIVVEKNKTNLKLEFDDGMVGEKQKIITKTLTKVKVDALDESIYETAKVLEGLQNRAIIKVKRVDETVLEEA